MNFSFLTNDKRGFTVLEVLIAALITGILTTATFRFYTSMNEQSETQYNISEMQQLCRNSLDDIRHSLLQAGFKLNGHPAYTIDADTLAVYYEGTQPVDTVLYHLVEYTDAQYGSIPDLPTGHRLYFLIKKVNSDAETVFADHVSSISYNQIDSANIAVTINVHAQRSDPSYHINDGFRTYSLSERVKLRNVN